MEKRFATGFTVPFVATASTEACFNRNFAQKISKKEASCLDCHHLLLPFKRAAILTIGERVVLFLIPLE